jgi:chromosome segregation ATPase
LCVFQTLSLITMSSDNEDDPTSMVSTLLTQLEDSHKEVQSFKHQLMNFRAVNVRSTAAASKDREEQESKIDTVEARVKELEEEKETLEREKDAEIKKLKEQNEKLSKENRELLDTKSKLQARDTERQSHLQTLTTELTQMQQLSLFVEQAELQAVWEQLELVHHEMANVQELFQSVEAWFWKLRRNKDIAVHLENSSVTLSVLEDTMDVIRERLEVLK